MHLIWQFDSVHEMQYVKPYASDQDLASYKNRKGSLHTVLYSVKYLQYMLKMLHYSHHKKHSVQLCTIGSRELLYHIPLKTSQKSNDYDNVELDEQLSAEELISELLPE